jgi:hypothetical protein
MPKKAALALTLLALTACFLSYKLGSAPVALAKSHTPQQDSSVAPPLPTAPATWALTAALTNAQVSVTRPAGGAGVKHVATCIAGFALLSTSGTLGTVYALELWDGAPGTGTLLFETGAGAPLGVTGHVELCDLNIVGSPNTAMTLEFTSHAATLSQGVNLVGYDAQ